MKGVSNQQRTEGAGGSPRRQHKSIDGANVFGAEVVRGEGGHGTKTSAIAHEDDERYEGENSSGRDRGKYPKQGELEEKHYRESPSASNGVRDPGPDDASGCVAYADDADHSCGNGHGDGSNFLEHGRLLRDEGDAGGGIKKKQ